MITHSGLQTIIDIQTVVSDSSAQGVELERFPHFPHGENGILKISGGARVAWFRDPDGNLLSVVEYATLDGGRHSEAQEADAVFADARGQEPL